MKWRLFLAAKERVESLRVAVLRKSVSKKDLESSANLLLGEKVLVLTLLINLLGLSQYLMLFFRPLALESYQKMRFSGFMNINKVACEGYLLR